ncbi:hypothetical protein CWI38_2162p0010 [Hamiltosporidium tvaerminnensis]|uniref:Uncharacterized protein n=1 Tax=Hamiltosporidium tvaerminnensis TaxID=1176355 RepID=A0A4Q9LPM1_9MICR|nr:hypothetical protein CWI38_2162p0010 [Hamiltosporidium tvaerminnensis]
MTWDGIVTKYHKTYVKRLQISMNVEAYIQSIVLKKTLETISFDRRRGLESKPNAEESWVRVLMGVIMLAEMNEEPHLLQNKELDNEEYDAKTENTKNILPLISDGINNHSKATNN